MGRYVSLKISEVSSKFFSPDVKQPDFLNIVQVNDVFRIKDSTTLLTWHASNPLAIPSGFDSSNSNEQSTAAKFQE